MATTATLTIIADDVIGADYDSSRASVWIEANTDHSLIRVDGTDVRVGGRAEKFVNGVATFELITTNSTDDDFAYRGTITYVEKGSREQGRKFLPISDFPLTADANLAAIEEAWDNVTIPVSWRSAFLDQIQEIAGINDVAGALELLIPTFASVTEAEEALGTGELTVGQKFFITGA